MEILQRLLLPEQRLQDRTSNVKQFKQSEAALQVAALDRFGGVPGIGDDRCPQELQFGECAGQSVISAACDACQNEPVYRTFGRRLGERFLGGVDVSGVLVEDRESVV